VNPPRVYSFGDFAVDLDRGCLLREGQEIKLRPKVFAALKHLVENRSRLVTKADLVAAVWSDAFVTDDSIVQCLVELRRALGDEEQALIKTVPRRGYIFAADVKEASAGGAAAEPMAAAAPARGRRRWGAVVAAAAILLALAVAGLRTRRRPAEPGGAALARLVPLTHGEGNDENPSFAPDGGSLVFASDRSGNSDLWVSLAAGGPPVRITDTPEAESHPAWSPDGSRVAFVRMRQDKPVPDVFVMPALGGEARRLVEQGTDPAWSPDGRQIAFTEWVGGWTRIAKTTADGAAPVAITPVERGYFHRHPAWSLDGRLLVFNRSPGGYAGQVMRVSSEGGPAQQLTRDPDGTANLVGAVSADGKWVVHVSDRGGAMNLWRIPLAGGTPERITSGPGRDLDPCVSRDGRRIAYVSNPQFFRLLRVSLESGEATALASFEGSDVWAPDVSPDGSLVAFVQKVPGRPWRLTLRAAAGRTPRTLLEELPYDVLWARFLPDGATLVFDARRPAGRIGTVRTDGSGLAWLTPEEEDASYPDVSPVARLLAYVRNEDSRSEIVVRPLDGGAARTIVSGATLPRFSPDGRWIAFAGTRTYTQGVGVVDVGGREKRWVTRTGTWPTWMPDGHTLAFGDLGPHGDQTAWAVDVREGKPQPLAAFRWQGTVWPFVVTRDGRHLVTTDGSAIKSTIWLGEF
jgi:Tol biopolymer transport system component/DNA-binding winged helix-turn-helix (wHTH) protein